MGYYIDIVPLENAGWSKGVLLQQIAAAGLEPHPEYEEEFLVARSGVAMVYPVKGGARECFVVIRVSSMADPDDYMPTIRALAAHLKGRLIFEQRFEETTGP
jgi:hypothetical protein